MEKFAKLYRLKGGSQVLLTKDFDNEDADGEFELIMETFIDDVKAIIKLSYKNEKERDEQFEEYNIEKAKTFRVSMEKLWK